jgi:hypothetical protein
MLGVGIQQSVIAGEGLHILLLYCRCSLLPTFAGVARHHTEYHLTLKETEFPCKVWVQNI